MPTNMSDIILTNIDVENDNLFTAIPATITDTSLLNAENKVTVETAINIGLPILPELPVQWPAGGGAVMTFPLAVGDDVLVIFSMRSIVEFQNSQSGSVTPFDQRHHDLSDGYVIPSIFRDADQPSPNPDDVEIKFADGAFRLTKDGTVQFDVAETISVTNTTGELIDLLTQTLTAISNTTVNTMLGPQPLINKIVIQDLIAEVESFKE